MFYHIHCVTLSSRHAWLLPFELPGAVITHRGPAQDGANLYFYLKKGTWRRGGWRGERRGEDSHEACPSKTLSSVVEPLSIAHVPVNNQLYSSVHKLHLGGCVSSVCRQRPRWGESTSCLFWTSSHSTVLLLRRRWLWGKAPFGESEQEEHISFCSMPILNHTSHHLIFTSQISSCLQNL